MKSPPAASHETIDLEVGSSRLPSHGPLQALAMAEAARAAGCGGQDGGVDFRYRQESWLFDYQGMIVRPSLGRRRPPSSGTATAAYRLRNAAEREPVNPGNRERRNRTDIPGRLSRPARQIRQGSRLRGRPCRLGRQGHDRAAPQTRSEGTRLELAWPTETGRGPD